MNRSGLILIICLMLTGLVGCSRGAAQPDDGYDVSMSVEPQDLRVGTTTVLITINDPAGEPVSDAIVTLEGDMTHAGMLPSNATTVEIAPGQYQGELALTMGGEWLVLVQAQLPNGDTIERTFPLGNVSG